MDANKVEESWSRIVAMAQSGRPDLVDGLYDFRCLMSELEIDDASTPIDTATPVSGSGPKVGADLRSAGRLHAQVAMAPDRASPTLVPSTQLQATVPRHQQVSLAPRTDILGQRPPSVLFCLFKLISPALPLLLIFCELSLCPKGLVLEEHRYLFLVLYSLNSFSLISCLYLAFYPSQKCIVVLIYRVSISTGSFGEKMMIFERFSQVVTCEEMLFANK